MSLHYLFSVEYAEKYGLNEAIMLHNFIYWININKANNNNFINGKYWTYNSSKAFQKLFPFWTQKQIEYTLSKLTTLGILIKDCFNEDKRDRTAWYTLSDDFFNKCISEKKEMHATNLGNDISEKKEMIYITDKKQQIKNTDKNNINTTSAFSLSQSNCKENLDSTTTKENLVVQFQEFWNLYEQPQKVIDWNKPNIARQKAFSKFQARLKETTFEELMQAVNDYLEYKQIETSGTPKMGVDVFLGGKCFENYRTKINDIYKKQGKPLPIAQKSPEKRQEEVKVKEDTQKKRESVLKHLNGDEVCFMNHIKKVLKPYFSELHKPWIDDFIFSCRKKVAYFGFTEQKHIDTVKRNFEKFERIIMREIASTELVREGEDLKIELKLID